MPKLAKEFMYFENNISVKAPLHISDVKPAFINLSQAII